MNGPQFWQTIMGRTFVEHTMPNLVKQLARLNDNLERILAQPTREATDTRNPESDKEPQ